MRLVFLNKFINADLTLYRILSNVFGINKRSADAVLSSVGLKGTFKGEEITTLQLSELEEVLADNFELNRELSEKLDNIKEEMLLIRTVRSFRYRNRLPINGQRTHSNAQTARTKVL